MTTNHTFATTQEAYQAGYQAGATDSKFVIRKAQAAPQGSPYVADITPDGNDWKYTGLKVLELATGESHTFNTQDEELLLLPFEGAYQASILNETYTLEGRESIFTAVTDYVFVPHSTEVTVTATTGGRLALPAAMANKSVELTPTYCGKDKVRVELRGAGNCSRQVNNYALGNELQTSKLLACEVLTPGGNWSSYPPHKHDENSDCERELEEIYYFEVRQAPDGTEGFALHRTYGTPDRPIDICIEVRSGDIALTPHGYHGPCAAAPGYDLYYFNVMAGPSDEVEWLMTDDPAHTWVRSLWENVPVDPRLPMNK